MVNVLFISLSSLDNDSRILKSISSAQKNNYKIDTISKDTKKVFNFSNVNIDYKAKRYFGIPKIGICFLWYKIIKILYSLPLNKYSILHCNDLNTLPIGVIVKKLFNKNVKIVYDAHEYETEMNGLQGTQKTVTKFLERTLIKHVDKVITVSDAIADEYVRLYNIEKPSLVLNTPPYKRIEKKNIFRETFNISKEKIIFLYQGGLSKGRGIEILLDTFKIMNNNQSVIVFMGYGSLESSIIQAQESNDNIYFHKAVSPEILLAYTSSADFGISTIEDTCLSYRYCLPNKMFEYLMAELPVIVSNLPEMRKLVENNNIGTVAEQNTPEGLKKAIDKAITLDKVELQKNIQKVKEVYNWEEQEKVLLKVYKDLD